MMDIYTNKKSSGVYWLGEIPNHWIVTSLKRILSEPLKYGATEAGDCDDRSLPRYLRITDFDNDGSLRSDTFASLPVEIATEYSVKDGDILFARSGATVGKTFLFRNYQGQACFAGYLIKASPARHKITSEFLYYFTKSPAYDAWKDFTFTQATIQNIGADKYAYLPVCLPPISEQERIATYLDESCKAIDAAVAAKRSQLDALAALRKSTIQQAVTKGLHPDVKIIHSDSDSSGDIPAHWKIDRMKDVVMLRNEKTDEASEVEDYLELEDMESATGRIINRRNTLEVESAVTFFQKDDILFGKLRPYLEKYFQADFDGKCTGEILAFKPTGISSRFLFYCVASPWFIERCNALAYGAKMPRVNWQTQLASFVFPIPPIDEQRAICTFLDTKLDELVLVVRSIENQIETLSAYRKSLIHECVTGQRRITETDLERVQAHA